MTATFAIVKRLLASKRFTIAKIAVILLYPPYVRPFG